MEHMFKDRILIIAIVISVVWHIFWISITTIVAPKERRPIKFSRVSFLGPILERGALEVRLEPRERSFLEKHYLSGISGHDVKPNISDQQILYIKDFSYSHDEGLVDLIEEAVNSSKTEPSYIVR